MIPSEYQLSLPQSEQQRLQNHPQAFVFRESVKEIIDNLTALTGMINDTVASAHNIQQTTDAGADEMNEIGNVVAVENTSMQNVNNATSSIIKLTDELDKMVGEFSL